MASPGILGRPSLPVPLNQWPIRQQILFDAMALDGVQPVRLRVDGGMAANDWLMQFLSDVLDMPVDRPRILETTALGAAMFAGLADGAHASLDDMAASWQQDRQFTPAMADDKRRLIRLDGLKRS